MDAVRVALLREVLAGTEWLRDTRRFAGALRGSVGAHGGGLLLLGTAEYEPWHLAAHLDEEAARSGRPGLHPTLVRHRVPPGAPAHLASGLDRLTGAGRGRTLLVVAPQGGPPPGEALLERVDDVRRGGATVLALDGGTPDGGAGATGGDARELRTLAHEVLSAPASAGLDLDTVQHLVSAAAGEDVPPGRRFRDRLSRLAARLTAPPPEPW
ncbi:hypothetical protein [Streptomyces sp. I05A-00742]|uniref:hypothetical protein n=1 Tax=Streptomyces sp. I05A-00742 TaxID=2732853 RepID=UPI001487FE39|nr:hypothetical protein [Streptomyces sp. I05A-00742]